MDRIVEAHITSAPEMPLVLTNVLHFALKEGKRALESGDGLYPFTVLAVKDKLFTEDASANSPEESYALARHTVTGARGADAYGMCYDGYIDYDDKQADAIIAEGGVPHGAQGYAVALPYKVNDDGSFEFAESPTYIGPAPNFMAHTGEVVQDDDGDAEEQKEAADDAQDAGEPEAE